MGDTIGNTNRYDLELRRIDIAWEIVKERLRQKKARIEPVFQTRTLKAR